MSQKTTLVIITNGVEELEAIAPIDCLRRAGVQTTVASASASLEAEGRNGIRLLADTLLDNCLDREFDLIVIPGGPGHTAMAQDQRILALLRNQAEGGRLIGSICAGPIVLDEAGVLQGHAFTSFPGTKDRLPGRDGSRKVVRDGNLITSQGAGTATQFAIALVEALCGEPTAQEIAASICA
jgi:4-methyl-5(b-hydroxyethyl)-thiazole monophosphate biosynthesis